MRGEDTLGERLAVADPQRDVDPERARAAGRAIRNRDSVGDPLRARDHRSRGSRQSAQPSAATASRHARRALPSPAQAPRQRAAAGVASPPAELLLDPQQSVVLADAVRAGQRPGLDLPAAAPDREVGDGGVFGLAGAVRDDRCVARLARDADRLERLRKRSDLVELDQDRVADLL